MITAILIDDEKHCNETLKIELKRHCPNLKVIGDYTSGKEGIIAIKKLKPNLVFLDIEMPWMSGFEVLQQFEELNFDVVFITAYDNYAIQAFRYSAVDYLLKPIKNDLLIEAVDKVSKKAQHQVPLLQVETLLYNLQRNQTSSRVVFSMTEGLEIVETNNIIRCQSENNYTHIYLKDGKPILLAKTLKEVEKMISGNDFVRVHQSHLVNMDYVKKFIKSDGGYLIMKDGKQVGVSKSRREHLMLSFKKFNLG